jgi:hypothetical protein
LKVDILDENKMKSNEEKEVNSKDFIFQNRHLFFFEAMEIIL